MNGPATPPEGALAGWVGLDPEALIEAIESSCTVLLHAALYSNFATNAIGEALERQLASGDLARLIVISSGVGPWLAAFEQMLRPQLSDEERAELVRQSDNWCADLQSRYLEKVMWVQSDQLPTQPVLICDDQLIVGHYAHCLVPAAEGIWLVLGGLAEGQVEEWLSGAEPDEQTSVWERACYRHVAECRSALNCARNGEVRE
ncbi:conserved hypothetical protein [Ferrimonas balearica DSM 9799]|uniref:Uncharacterized protein n=1 Tax=Ferrimonas balearica (strain DSM 9799 / CCM 4581 / KCTC 23876 / PAT) TaxID=550540 RepID=E1SUC1_FERBD|nr:hypothetical protein [Ferrimonas balearica]ADN76254.1 conserved hypothetical protein [Ferrimonas balearica DSM 9799]